MRRIWVPQTVASMLLLWAVYPDNPYEYYTLLRWVCCGAFSFLSFNAIAHKSIGWEWTFGTMAALYNPLVPVDLNRTLWVITNIATVIIAIVSIFVLPFSSPRPTRGLNRNTSHLGNKLELSTTGASAGGGRKNPHTTPISTLFAWALLVMAIVAAAGAYLGTEHYRDRSMDALAHGRVHRGVFVFLVLLFHLFSLVQA